MSETHYKSELENVSGKKDRYEFQDPNKQVVHKAADMGINTFYQTCAGGLGLIIQFLLPNDYKCKRSIVDIDEDKINLYTCIRDNYYELMNVLKCFIAFVSSFSWVSLEFRYESSAKQIVDKATAHLTASGYSPSIVKAAITFFNLIHNQRATNSTIKERIDELKKKLPFIAELSNILEGVEIKQNDLKEVIKKYSRRRKYILFIDPPYLLTNGNYAVNESEFEFHLGLADLLHSCSCKFVLYCRVTASKFSGKNDDKRLIDDVLFAFYSNHYPKEKYYFCDVELKHGDNVTVERMITNLDMSGDKGWIAY